MSHRRPAETHATGCSVESAKRPACYLFPRDAGDTSLVMNGRELFDPYVARAAPTQLGSSSVSYARMACYAVAISSSLSMALGGLSALKFASGLERFGGLEYVPRVLVLSAVRSLAPGIAFVLPCLTAVTLVHRARDRGENPVTVEGGRVFLVGGAIALLYPVNVACLLLGGLLVMRVTYAVHAVDFVAQGSQGLEWADAAFGAAETVAYALLGALLLPHLLRRVAAAWRRGLLVKLIAVWLAAQAAVFVVSTTVAVLAAGPT
jgi:hypothetical protein